MNKKAGSILGASVFFFLFIYFVVFILVADGADSMGTENDDINVTDFSGTDGGLYGIGYFGQVCNTPRYEYDPESTDVSETNDPDHLDCERTKGVLRSDICNSIEGCSWENVTSGFWFWETTEDATCLGSINASYYGIDTTSFLGREVVVEHSNTEVFRDRYGSKKSICNHPNVVRNESLCNTFSCTFDFLQTDLEDTGLSSIRRTAGDVFTFRYDFDVENSVLSFVINFVLVILPMIALLISIYFMLPIVH